MTSTVNKDGSTAWSIDSAAYNTWTESVKKNPTLIVQRAMWIDARIEQEFVALDVRRNLAADSQNADAIFSLGEADTLQETQHTLAS